MSEPETPERWPLSRCRETLWEAASQRDAARAIDCGPLTFLHWEKGRVAPDVRFWPAILAFLGYDPRPPWPGPAASAAGDVLESSKRRSLKMIVQKPSDLLAYLSDTGPISLEDLVIRSGSDAGEVIQDLAQLVQSGEVEVTGVDRRDLQHNLEELQHSLEQLDVVAVPSQEAVGGETRNSGDSAALATEMQRSLYEGLRHMRAGEAQLQLSFKGFRRLPSLQRR